MKDKAQFLKKYNLTEDQFLGNEEIDESLDLESLTSIPEGFNPTVGGRLDLQSLTSIPEGFNPTVGGWLDLRSLTSIPEGFNPTVGGWLDLGSLTSIPEGFNPTVGGRLDLRSLTSIPEGFNPTVGGWLDLESLTSIPEGFNPTVGGRLDLRSLTSIPEGFNPTVGGWLDLESGLVNVKTKTPAYPLTWDDGKYILVDDILCEVKSQKGNIRLCAGIANNKEFYVVQNGKHFAHGESLRQANTDLAFKMSKRDPSEFRGLPLDTVLTIEKAVVCYRVITGACNFGVNEFLSGLEKIKDKYSIKEIIGLTKGQYGGKQFALFFTA